jgi:biopolymer transport protein ExbD
MARSFSIEQQTNPLLDLNTTPLIDVLLVLLVMFIITIPMQTHAVKLDLPAACPRCPTAERDVNTVAIGASGQIAWNMTPVSVPEFRTLLAQTQAMNPAPELHLMPDAGARYGTVDQVLAEIKLARVQKFGFVGNEAHRNVF